MSERLPPPSRWCPPEITDAAVPLRVATEVLRQLRDDHKRVVALADSSPSVLVRASLQTFVGRWSQSSWALQDTTDSLAMNLRWAAESYRGTEADLARRLVLANPDHEGRW